MPRLSALFAVVLFASMGCYDARRVVEPDEVLLVTATPESIPADGFSTSRLTARISTSASRDLTISFKTSGGVLSTTQPLAPDSGGSASVLLTSGTSPGSALVTVEVKSGLNVLASQTVPVTFSATAPGSVIRLSISNNQVDADGVSSIQLRAEVNPSVSPRTVSFKTTNGTFSRSGITAVTELKDVALSADGVAVAQLFAPEGAGTAVVTATAGGFLASQTITFEPAAPDFISLSATPLEVRALETSVVKLVAKLSRSIGKVTRNSRVDLTIANDALKTSFGRFQSVTRSDESETVTAEFVPGVAAPLGLATITATSADDGTVVARVKVNIIP